MRFEIVEPFDQYAAIQNAQPGGLGSEWYLSAENIAIMSMVLGIDGVGLALSIGNGSNGITARKPFAIPDEKMSLHFGMKLTNLQASPIVHTNCVDVLDDTGAHQFGFKVNPLGKLLLRSNGVVLATSERQLHVGVAHRICVTSDMTNANATQISVAIDSDTPDPNMDGLVVDAQATASQLHGGLMLRESHATEHGTIFDDVVVGLEDCTLWGPLEVAMQAPTSDVENDWTRSAGANNYANVDELPFTGEADYNYSTVVGDRDMFGIADPTRTPEFIVCVSQLTLGRKEDSATRRIANVLRKGVTDYYGNDDAMIESYYHHWTHRALDPDTGLAWNPADFPALQSGYEHRAA